MSKDRKLVYFLISFCIVSSIILLVKIKATPKYDPKIYDEIYTEYEAIFGENNDKLRDDSFITTENLNLQNNSKIDKVIGEIIIPSIDIQYPIIKETTMEYLKIAPTKYCGPDVNEIRKSSNSRAQL